MTRMLTCPHCGEGMAVVRSDDKRYEECLDPSREGEQHEWHNHSEGNEPFPGCPGCPTNGPRPCAACGRYSPGTGCSLTDCPGYLAPASDGAS